MTTVEAGIAITTKLSDPGYLPTRTEVLGTLGLNGLHKFGEQHNIYEFWTTEYIDGFGRYLNGRVREMHATKDDKITILEVGAGDGRLSVFLRTRGLGDANDVANVYATDNGAWKVKRRFPVTRLPYREALRQAQPDIVISSWMLNGQDWTPSFRSTPSVKEYILIGDSDNCGTFDTYGMAPGFTFHDWIETDNGAFVFKNPPGYVPPHQRSGFTMTNLQNLSRLQIGYTDYQVGNEKIQRSRTLSFRRTLG